MLNSNIFLLPDVQNGDEEEDFHADASINVGDPSRDDRSSEESLAEDKRWYHQNIIPPLTTDILF